MFKFADLVAETAVNPGSGSFTLAGPLTARRAFDSTGAHAVGDWVVYCARHRTANEWEIAVGKLTASTTLTRAKIWHSSNANAVVAFSAGTVDVFEVVPAALSQMYPERAYYAFTDFLGTNNADNWTASVSGTGSAWSSVAPAAENAIGIMRHAAGTVATNRGAFGSTNQNVMKLGGGLTRFRARHKVATLSDATNTYTMRIGFLDSVTAESTDGVFFRYQHTVSANWQCVTRNNNTETVTTTSVAVSTAAFHKFEVTVDPDGASAEFRIDGTVVATHTANIPTASGREVGFSVMMLRTVGTAAFNSMDMDWMDILKLFDTER